MSTTKTYESLQDLNSSANAGYGKGPAVKIIQCSALLPNHMQCWRASDVLITTIATSPALSTVDPNTVIEDGKEVTTITTTQMCNRHAVMDQQEYLKTQQDEQAVKVAQEAVAADTAADVKASVTPATTIKK